jgi:predicted nucleic acid-binding protein
MSARPATRLFLDSNVLTRGIISPWSFDHALLKLCASRIHKMVLAEIVKLEVENNLLSLIYKAGSQFSDIILSDYDRFIKEAAPEIIPAPSASEVTKARRLIRHRADVPVLLSAMKSHPDWLITHNKKHFTQQVALRTGLRIADPEEFFRSFHQTQI